MPCPDRNSDHWSLNQFCQCLHNKPSTEFATHHYYLSIYIIAIVPTNNCDIQGQYAYKLALIKSSASSKSTIY